MGLPLALHTSFPESLSHRFSSHNSGQEHYGKHVGDINDVQASRLSRGLEPIENLVGIMKRGGMRVIRMVRDDGGEGEAVGYGVVSKSPDGKDLTVEDVWVDEAHRHRGFAGFLLGKIITATLLDFRPAWLQKQVIGKSLSWGNSSFILPGVIYTVNDMAYGVKVKPKDQQKFYDWLPSDWTGIILSNRKGHKPAEQYIDGKVVASFTSHRDGKYTIDGATAKKYDNIAIAAIVALNP